MPVTNEQLANAAYSTVAGGAGGLGTALGIGDQTLILPTGDGAKFPATANGQFRVTFGKTLPVGSLYEIAMCTSRTGDTLTLIRGLEGTTGRLWAVGTAVEQDATAGTFASVYTRIQSAPMNVRDWGAKGDGVTDDAPSFRAAMLQLYTNGGGALYVPAGTYLMNSLVANVGSAGNSQAFWIPPNVTLLGDGKGVTIIKRGASQAANTYVIMNRNASLSANTNNSPTDNHISIARLTIDGNAANQSPGANTAHTTIGMYGVRGFFMDDVEILNSYGLGTTGSSEGFAVTFDLSIDATFRSCEVIGTTANTSSGFSANYSSNVKWIGCTARGSGSGHGFAIYQCDSSMLESCVAYSNGTSVSADGIHFEQCSDISLTSCAAGIIAATNLSAPGGVANYYTSQQSLGNGGSGSGFSFTQCDRISLDNCLAAGNNNGISITGPGIGNTGPNRFSLNNCVIWKNTGNGLVENGMTAGNLAMSNCQFLNNTANNGLSLDANGGKFTSLRNYVFSGNTTDFLLNGTSTPVLGKITTNAPAVPATTVALTNPFPFDCHVFIFTGAAVTVSALSLDGVATGLTLPINGQTFVRVRAGGTITLAYAGGTPTWNWFGTP